MVHRTARPAREQATPKRRRSLRADAPHAEVAARFRYFLEAKGLSREAFVDAVDHAVTARSLFSVLSGARQPSRALAVLMERTWGFRADFLLAGEGAMWTRKEGPAAPALAPLEDEMLTFTRRSVDNARAMKRALDDARLWERLYARTTTMLRELEACAADPAQAPVYPAFAKLVYEECQLIADRFGQLVLLLHRRRVHRLTDMFLARYVDEQPRTMLQKSEAAELSVMLAPVLERRGARLRALEESIAGLRTTLENVCALGSPLPMLLERSTVRQAGRRHDAIARIEAATARGAKGSRLPPRVARELDVALAALKASDAAPTLAAQVKRMARDLLRELEIEIPIVPPQSRAELRALHEAIIDPLMA
jgi:hypothetical protein